MPSGSIVAIDPADNDVAILDASACALDLGAPSSGYVGDAEDRHHSNNKARASQSQYDGADGEGRALAPPAMAHQVSPMPQKKKTAAVPRTPLPGDGVVIVEDSAVKKANRKQAAPSAAKKPPATLHSFFCKANSAAKKKTTTNANKPSTKSKLAPFSAEDSAAHQLPAASPLATTKKKGASEATTSEQPPLPQTPTSPSTNAVEEPHAAPAAVREIVGNGIKDAKKSKKQTPPKKRKAKSEKNTDEEAEGNDNASRFTAAAAVKAKVSSQPAPTKNTKKLVAKKAVARKPLAVVKVSDESQELDDSPSYAVAVAFRTMSSGWSRRRTSGGKPQQNMRQVEELVVPSATTAATEEEDIAKVSSNEAVEAGGVTERNEDSAEVNNVKLIKEPLAATTAVATDKQRTGAVVQEDEAVDCITDTSNGDNADGKAPAEGSAHSEDARAAAAKEEHDGKIDESNVEVMSPACVLQVDVTQVGAVELESWGGMEDCKTDLVKGIPSNQQSNTKDILNVDCVEVSALPREPVEDAPDRGDDESAADAPVAIKKSAAGNPDMSKSEDVEELDVLTTDTQVNEQKEPLEEGVVVPADGAQERVSPPNKTPYEASKKNTTMDEVVNVPTGMTDPYPADQNETLVEEALVSVDSSNGVLEDSNIAKLASHEMSNKAPKENTMKDQVMVADKLQKAKKTIRRKKKGTKPLSKPQKKAVIASSSSMAAFLKKKPPVAARQKQVYSPSKATVTGDKEASTTVEMNGQSPIEASLHNSAAHPPIKSLSAIPLLAPTKKQNTEIKVAPESSKCNGTVASSTSPTASEKADAVAAATTSTPGAPDNSSRSESGVPENSLRTEEDTIRLRYYHCLREKYIARAMELDNRPAAKDFEEESLSFGCAAVEGSLIMPEKGSVEVGKDGFFPDRLLSPLSLAVQGRSQPLSVLAKQVLEELSPYVTNTHPLTLESISSKIKLLAERKSYLSGKPPAPSEKNSPISKPDCFENAEECYMWRWELVSVDLLPRKDLARVKKARAARKKLQGHHKAIMTLISAVDKATAWLQKSDANKSSTAVAVGEKLTIRVSETEERVLKFEREEEKARLLKEARLKKQKSKSAELDEKQREKDLEKKRQKEERAQKKAEAAEAKRKKIEEKEMEKRKKQSELEEKQQELEEKESKRKARMMSFFQKGVRKKKQKVAVVTKDVAQENPSMFDGEAFRKLINSRVEHLPNNVLARSEVLPCSRMSRRPRTPFVRVSVFVTVLSENAFAPQPYDEERVITVPNRYKFLGFHEDVRPPYRGTWSKTSSLVTGRRPFGKDVKYLDYENDSEEEWEEGDEEEGEDLQDDGDGNEEEEGEDMQNEEDNDGWLAAEDDLGIDDDDEETKEMRKRKLVDANALGARQSHFKACVVAPRMGGLSHLNIGVDDMQRIVEGFSPQDAMNTLTGHIGCVVTPDISNIYLDAFPPLDPAKDNQQGKKDPTSKACTAQNKEMTVEAQKIMAQFVHNSTTHKSKENLVTELLKAYPSVTNSRAQAMRELDVIAGKRRLAGGGGVVWEVKADHLKKLGLKKMDLKISPQESSLPKATGKEKDPDAPKRNKSAFIIYSNATRNDVKAANPSASFGQTAQIISKNYKALTPEERSSWNEQAAADKGRYQKEMVEYMAAKANATGNTITPSSVPLKVPAINNTKKRKKTEVSLAQANLFASFLNKKPKTA